MNKREMAIVSASGGQKRPASLQAFWSALAAIRKRGCAAVWEQVLCGEILTHLPSNKPLSL